MRRRLEDHYQRRLADALPGPDPVTRAALLIAVHTGVQTQRNVLRSSALRTEHSAAVVDLLAAALDLIGGDAPPPRCAESPKGLQAGGPPAFVRWGGPP